MHACADCARHVWTRQGFVDECPRCRVPMRELSAVVERMRKAAQAPRPGTAQFLARIPEFLAFPGNKSVLWMVVGLALITTPLYWATRNNLAPMFMVVGVAIVKALEASVYFRFVTQTAYGVRDITPPDVTDLVDDLFGPLFRYLVALLPIIGAAAWWGEEAMGSAVMGLLLFEFNITALLSSTGPAVLFVAGVALLPLTTVVAAISRSAISVLNPAVWVSSLRILGPSYLVAVIAFYAVLAFEYLALVPVALKLNLEHSVPVVTSLFTAITAYLAMALRARILGGLCEPHFSE